MISGGRRQRRFDGEAAAASGARARFRVREEREHGAEKAEEGEARQQAGLLILDQEHGSAAWR